MTFVSLSFALFFLIFVIIYHSAAYFSKYSQNKVCLIQNFILLLASLFFYAWADFRFLPFLLYTIFLTYISGVHCKNKATFVLCIFADLIPLLTLKYVPPMLHTSWVFPLGISFFTFQSISYIVDVYTKKIDAERNLLNVALYISFFPVVSSGPIQRAEKLIPQFNSVKHFDYDNATDGLKLFAWGMFKKICIADRIAVYVNYIYGNISEQYGIALLLATFLYSFQIYCDFSGYSDMAIGVARYLGFDAGKNFDHPYLSQSVGEFWRKWHISLSSWLRDYIYIPLGGSRVKVSRIYFNLMITFLVSGIWHGSTWNFLIWGFLHGFYQCIGRLSKPLWNRLKIPSFIKIFTTFCLITFAWIFFRANTLNDTGIVITKFFQIPQNIRDLISMKTNFGLKESLRILFALNDATFGGFSGMVKLLLVLSVFILFSLLTKNVNVINYLKHTSFLLRWCLYFIFIILLIYFSYFEVSSNFIYNQF